MGINVEAFGMPAKRGDISGVAINCAIALGEIANCLEDITHQRPVNPASIAKIRETSIIIQKIFEDLTAWTND